MEGAINLNRAAICTITLRSLINYYKGGYSNVSTKEEILSVGPSQLEIIGPPVMVGL